MFEIDVEAVADMVASRPQWDVGFKPFGRYPESVRDMSVVVDLDAEAGRVLAVARRTRPVVDVTVFDEYRGKGLPAGKKAIGLRIVYQSPEKTLTSEEIDIAQAAILRGLEV